MIKIAGPYTVFRTHDSVCARKFINYPSLRGIYLEKDGKYSYYCHNGKIFVCGNKEDAMKRLDISLIEQGFKLIDDQETFDNLKILL